MTISQAVCSLLCEPEKLPERFHFLQFMMTSVGLDIFTDELLQLFSRKNKA